MVTSSDDLSDNVTGYLIVLPAKGLLRDVLSCAHHSGRPISWERLERWCQQLVRAVSEVHKRGMVIGSLGASRCSGIGISSDDEIVLLDGFQRRFSVDSAGPAAIPPEHRLAAIRGGSIRASRD